MKYRIVGSRLDESPRVYEVFEAENDEQAQEKLRQYDVNPSYGWDFLELIRIDQEEKTTLVSRNKRLQESLSKV